LEDISFPRIQKPLFTASHQYRTARKKTAKKGLGILCFFVVSFLKTWHVEKIFSFDPKSKTHLNRASENRESISSEGLSASAPEQEKHTALYREQRCWTSFVVAPDFPLAHPLELKAMMLTFSKCES
jgi:hypothetical protein